MCFKSTLKDIVFLTLSIKNAAFCLVMSNKKAGSSVDGPAQNILNRVY